MDLDWGHFSLDLSWVQEITLKLLKTAYHFFGYSEDSSEILELPTIIGCWEYGKQFSLIEKFIAFLDNLMRSTYQIKAILIKELIDNFSSIYIAYPSFKVIIPTFIYPLRIWPEQIWDNLASCELERSFNLIELI
jgi:hypothetical protein